MRWIKDLYALKLLRTQIKEVRSLGGIRYSLRDKVEEKRREIFNASRTSLSNRTISIDEIIDADYPEIQKLKDELFDLKLQLKKIDDKILDRQHSVRMLKQDLGVDYDG